jgi:hypothetical protein
MDVMDSHALTVAFDIGFNEEQKKFNDKISANVSNITKGLGKNLELYNKSWMEKYVPGLLKNSLLHGFKFPDPEKTIHKDQTMVELDLFCSEPLVEVKTFIDQRQFKKIINFTKTVELIRRAYGETMRGGPM